MIKRGKSDFSLPDFFMVAYCAASFLVVAYGSRAKYVMLGSSVLVFISAAVKQKGKLRISIGAFHLLSVAFLLFCCFSSVWAVDPSLTLNRSSTIFQILITLYLAYVYYQDKSVSHLMLAMMWGGYVVCLIALRDQGLDTYLRAILLGRRVYDMEYINANVMGMLMASSLVINFYFILYEKRVRWWTIFAIPAFICLLGAGSKKGILLLVGGFGMILVLRNINSREKIYSTLKILVIGVAFVALLVALIKLPIFSFIRKRFDGVINFLSGRGEVDGSTLGRAALMEVGVRLFRKFPILGVGIDNPQLFSGGSYLHNNYIELLAGGGVIGFSLYYGMYVYIFWNFWKYKPYRTGEYDCCLTVLLLHFVLEFAYVSYFNKETWFYFILGVAEVRRLKIAAKQQKIIIGGN